MSRQILKWAGLLVAIPLAFERTGRSLPVVRDLNFERTGRSLPVVRGLNFERTGRSLPVVRDLNLAAQDSSPRIDQGARKMMRSPDTAFAMKAAQGGVAEVETGKLAAEKASSPDVKAFGQQMVDDHSKINEQLKSIAEKQNITLPTGMNAKQKAEHEKLSALSGAEFDRTYVASMLKDHEEDVKEFQKQANNGKDDAIKSFAAQTLPILQSHLEHIQSIKAKM